MWLLFGLGTAVAGSGPWTLRSGQTNLYAGVSYHRYDAFIGPGVFSTDQLGGRTVAPNVGSDGRRVLQEIGSPVTSYGIDGVWTLGLRPRLEAELKFSFESVRVNDPASSGVCPRDEESEFCKPTAGIGDLYGTLKWLVVDEFAGAPLSAALRFELRTGEAYANTRDRLTNLGEGQTDAGVQISVGRKAYLNTASMRAHLTAGYFYSFPNGFYINNGPYDPTAQLGENDKRVKAPADEISIDAEIMITPIPAFEIGPAVTFLERLGGVPIGVDTDGNAFQDPTDPNNWNRLDATQLKVGGKMSLFSTRQRTITLTVLGTVYAENNPANGVTIALGGGQLFWSKRKEQDGPNL